MLEKMRQWLETFPGWEGTLQLDYVDAVPDSTGLYPRGLTELSRREDVLGNLTVRCRCDFLLRRTAGQSAENAQWLLDFQSWVMEQDRLGLAPAFGDVPGTQQLRASEGRLDSHKQVGSALYTVQLSVEFTKFYEVN